MGSDRSVTRASYDRLSRWYDLLTGQEQKLVRQTVGWLGAGPGNHALEIGPGTGHGLLALAGDVGGSGRVVGVDLSPAMLRRARERAQRAGAARRVRLVCGDGARLPVRSGCFDLVLLSFTLELFDADEIPTVISECLRILRPGGRIGIAALSSARGRPCMLRLYEWAHVHFPRWVDCRPISAEQALCAGGFHIVETVEVSVWGLPVDIIIATKGGA